MATYSDPVVPSEAEQPVLELGAACQAYVRGLPVEDKQLVEPELRRFMRWLGTERPVASIRPPEIGDYGDMIGAHGTTPDAAERLGMVKLFLTQLRKQGSVGMNLAQHLRLRKGRSSAGRAKAILGHQVVRLTKTGYADLTKKLEQLQAERLRWTEEIHEAAQDKDVRENAPLEAAREQQGMVMAKILEAQATLNMAVVIDPSKGVAGETKQIQLGSKFLLLDVSAEQETSYQLVEPDESSPLSGKISSASPVGAAMLGRSPGDQVRVQTPMGQQVYEVLKIG
ncbi:MAG: GreA/GreB family elongation factor [Chloroflexi bacterium]|nr:GreA/GreB family elongation factor [Chloroflexota bacterium]